MNERNAVQATALDTGRHRRFDRVPDWALLLIFCLVFSGQVIWTMQQKSATFDEGLNLVSGYVSLRFGDDRLIPQNLPFVKLLSAAPLFVFRDIALPPPPELWDALAQYRYASELLYKFNDADTLLFVGRLAVLPLSLLLGCSVFFWAKQLLGREAATFALLLYCLEPNILAHSGLVTTDIAAAGFMFLTIYGWYQLAQEITWTRILLPALTVGLGLITKFTTLPLLLIFLLLASVVVLGREPLKLRLRWFTTRPVAGRSSKLLACLLLGLISALLAYTIIWTVYRFRFETSVSPVPTYQTSWRNILPQSPLLRSAVVTALDFKLVPETYLYGLTFNWSAIGNLVGYLMEDMRPGGWWYYFLVTFSIKTPLPLILILVWALAAQRKFWFENPICAVCVFGPIVIYSGVMSITGWNMGHRHLLPIYPFLFILAGALIPWALRQGTLVKSGLAALVCWYGLASAWIAPHYLAYFNELVGGPDQGHHYLVDSNLDWGQDLKGLKKYMREQGIHHVWLSYFGQAEPDYYGITYDYLPSYHLYTPTNDRPQFWDAERLPPLPGTVAISATLLQGMYPPFPDPEIAKHYFEDYRQRRPIAKIGYSIFLYRFDARPPAGTAPTP